MMKPFLAHDPMIAAGFIEKWEGCKLEAYHCSADRPDLYTIGVGHAGVKAGTKITKSEALDILYSDIQAHNHELATCINVPVTENQFIALTSICFNIGAPRLKRSKLLAKLNAGDYEGAAKEFLDFDMAGGKKIRGLTLRRKDEHDLFLTDDEG